MADVRVMKRGKVYQYQFEIAPVDGKRKYINKSGFKTKKEAFDEGVKAYNEYEYSGQKVNVKDMQADIQSVINHVFNKKMFVYAVSRNQSIDLQALYMNLLQIGKLPKAKDVVLDFIGE